MKDHTNNRHPKNILEIVQIVNVVKIILKIC